MPTATLALTVTGGVLALFGTYWDESWHSYVGRDSFFSPPHLALYAGVVVALAGVGWWALAVRRVAGWGGVLQNRPLLAAAAGGATTLVAGPIDEAWHALFGRDAVLWSPPHMLGVIGMIALAAGVLAGGSRTRHHRGWSLALGVGLLGAALVPVMEYEADVPQFAALWYVPALVGGAVFTFGLVERALPGRWVVTQIAAAYTLLRIAILGTLTVQGFAAAFVPPLLVPAVVFDRARGWRPGPRATALVASLLVAYAPAMNVGYRGLRLGPLEVIVGGALAILLAWVFLARTGRTTAARPSSRAGTVVLSLVVLAALAPTAALAHDPGQGDPVVPVSLRAEVSTDEVEVRGTLARPNCGTLEPVATVARRAGRTHTGPLTAGDGCVFEGSVPLDEPGRWFVYLEFTDSEGEVLEAWLPVTPAETASLQPATEQKDVWAYHPAGAEVRRATQAISGVLLYSIAALLLGYAIRTPFGPEPARDRPGDG
ncbi:MAG: hypothetical protein KG028_11000 [Actinobacteria bacterium]|nr:hypothetical protein [Actinomycetota bacterium]